MVIDDRFWKEEYAEELDQELDVEHLFDADSRWEIAVNNAMNRAWNP